MTALDTNLVGELRAGFRGTLLRPGDDGYDEARRVWNGAVDRRPALIARCAGADDVVTAVRFAHKLSSLTDDVIDIFLGAIDTATSPFAQINGWAVGGAVSRVDDATAVGDRHDGFER